MIGLEDRQALARTSTRLIGPAHDSSAHFAERDRSFRVIVTGGGMLHE